MPYKDRDRQREAKRLSARMARAAEHGTRVEPAIPAPLRIRTALDVLELVGEQMAAVRGEPKIGTTERARTVGYLASVALRAVEQADLAARVEAVEHALKSRPRPENGEQTR